MKKVFLFIASLSLLTAVGGAGYYAFVFHPHQQQVLQDRKAAQERQAAEEQARAEAVTKNNQDFMDSLDRKAEQSSQQPTAVTPVAPASSNINCTSSNVGNSTYTNCY